MSVQYIYADDKKIPVDDAEEPQGGSIEDEIKRLQDENAALRKRMEIEEMLDRLNHIGEQRNEGNQKKEETMKEMKTPFLYRLELWNTVNKEIPVVEQFLGNASQRRTFGRGVFRVIGSKKNENGFRVDVGPWIDLPMGLQVKMIETAEEYLKELKKQKKDVEKGYDV